MLRSVDERLARLVEQQAGLVARRQLADCGVTWEESRSRVRSGRWSVRSPRVLSTTTGELTVHQRRWLGVLHAGPGSLLGHLTAAAELGLARWDRDDVTVLTGDVHPGAVDGIVFVRTRRPLSSLAAERPGVPTCRIEPAVLLWAAYQAPTPRAAHGAVAATLQQRLTLPRRLSHALEALKPLRGSSALARTIEQAAGGAHSGAELELGRLCRRHGLDRPARQTPRRDRQGRRRWTDAEWDLPDGWTLVLEVDGGHHRDPLEQSADARRSRRLTTRKRLVVRCTAYELTHEGDQVATDLVALGVPRAGRGSQTAGSGGLGPTTRI